MTAKTLSREPAPLGARLGRTAETAAFALLLACAASRCFLGEVPFRTSVLKVEAIAGASSAEVDCAGIRAELARVTFAVLLPGAVAVWLLGRALRGALQIRHAWLGAFLLAFAGWSLAGALNASDRRSALDAWIEQTALLAAGFLAAQLCADRRRFAVVVLLLAGLGVALAVKGLWQVGVEVPAQVEQFESDPAAMLERLGARPGTPEATMAEARIRDPSAKGFFPLANVFASLMIVLVASAAGLAAGRFAAAGHARATWTGERGEIHMPTLAAILMAGAAAVAGLVLLLARSRGATLAAAVAAGGAVVVLAWRRRLSRHRRAAILTIGALAVAGLAAVVGYGLARDRLPSKTMTFRWFYWTASAEMAAEHPWLGVGPGNFAPAYLRHRRLPGGEEAVKLPHSFVAHAAAQYGLPGGALYVALVVGVLLVLCRPGASDQHPQAEGSLVGDTHSGSTPAAGRRGRIALAAGLGLAVLTTRAYFGGAAAGGALFVLDALLPAVVLAGVLLLVLWSGGTRFLDVAASPQAQICLGAGLFGFVVHNLVTFSLWTPGAALAFWLAAGALLGQAPSRSRRLLRLHWPTALAAGGGVAACVVLLWWPVVNKTALTLRATEALRTGAGLRAVALATRAAEADPLDPVIAADLAKLEFAATGDTRWDQQAARRDPANPSWGQLRAQIAFERSARTQDPKAIADATRAIERAVELDPTNARLRMQAARILLASGRPQDAAAQIDRARHIDAAHYPESTFRLTPAEREELAELRREAEAAAEPNAG